MATRPSHLDLIGPKDTTTPNILSGSEDNLDHRISRWLYTSVRQSPEQEPEVRTLGPGGHPTKNPKIKS